MRAATTPRRFTSLHTKSLYEQCSQTFYWKVNYLYANLRCVKRKLFKSDQLDFMENQTDIFVYSLRKIFPPKVKTGENPTGSGNVRADGAGKRRIFYINY